MLERKTKKWEKVLEKREWKSWFNAIFSLPLLYVER
jgi:hypothetical protein